MRNTLFFTLFLSLLSGFLVAQTVTPWLTRGDQSALLSQRPALNFGGATQATTATITLDANNTFQTIDGFGFCLTQASAFVIRGLNNNQRSALLNELFGANGLAMEGVRISIGASDLSDSVYSYNEMPGDVNMNNFSLAGPDQRDLIPILQEILAINPNIKVLATPWSAPSWMKTNGSFIGGSLLLNRYDAYARYFVRYLQAMDAAGIPIWGITPQNEPENPFNEPSMLMNANEQLDFINNHLGPQLAASGYTPKIIAFDHNCDNPGYPTQVLNNSSLVDGAAFHLYAGDISAMGQVQNATGKNVYFTEQFTGSGGNFSGDFSWHMRNVVIGSLNNWSKTVFEWNLAADTENGPRTPGGCEICLPAVTIPNANSYSRNVSYYIIAQVSKFIKADALRIGSSNNNEDLFSVAFNNPDGTRVLLAYNNGETNLSTRVIDGGVAFDYSVPAKSAVTFVWTPGSGTENRTPFNGSEITIPGIIEAENFDNGGQDLAYNDCNIENNGGAYRATGVDIENASEGGQNVGWTASGEWLTYSVNVAQAGNYDFIIRVASPGNAGRINISFDGSDKTGTVNIPSTGGWQVWQDVSVADVALAAGSQIMRINIVGGGFNLNRVTNRAVLPPLQFPHSRCRQASDQTIITTS